MSIKTNVNYPLLRQLVEMGILSSESLPYQVGPFKTNTEAFTGDTSGATKTLAQTPLTNGIMFAVTIATAAGTDNTLTALVKDTNYSLSGAIITYLADYSGHQVLIHYAY